MNVRMGGAGRGEHPQLNSKVDDPAVRAHDLIP